MLIVSPVESASPPSTESSPPRDGPSRGGSLRFRTKQRVTFGETQRYSIITIHCGQIHIYLCSVIFCVYVFMYLSFLLYIAIF